MARVDVYCPVALASYCVSIAPCLASTPRHAGPNGVGEGSEEAIHHLRRRPAAAPGEAHGQTVKSAEPGDRRTVHSYKKP